MKKDKGFTMLELLIVLTIIGILAGAGLRAIETYNAAKRREKSYQEKQKQEYNEREAIDPGYNNRTAQEPQRLSITELKVWKNDVLRYQTYYAYDFNSDGKIDEVRMPLGGNRYEIYQVNPNHPGLETLFTKLPKKFENTKKKFLKDN